jgi:hypothetical protein
MGGRAATPPPAPAHHAWCVRAGHECNANTQSNRQGCGASPEARPGFVDRRTVYVSGSLAGGIMIPPRTRRPRGSGADWSTSMVMLSLSASKMGGGALRDGTGEVAPRPMPKTPPSLATLEACLCALGRFSWPEVANEAHTWLEIVSRSRPSCSTGVLQWRGHYSWRSRWPVGPSITGVGFN